MQGVYVLDGVGDDLDFPGGAPSAHVLIVSHPGDDGACTVLAFDNGQFFDTPQCSRYDCRAKDGNTLRSSSQDAEFAFERVGGDIAGVWSIQKAGAGSMQFFSRQEGRAQDFLDEVRGVYALAGEDEPRSMVVVMPHLSDHREYVVTKIDALASASYIPGYRVEVEPSPTGETPFIRVSRDAGCGLHVEFAAKAGHWGTYTLTWCGILLHREDCDLPFRHEIHIE